MLNWFSDNFETYDPKREPLLHSCFATQVVTKVRRVEVESAKSQSALRDASAQNEQLRLQLEQLQEEQKAKVALLQESANKEKEDLQQEIARLNSKVMYKPFFVRLMRVFFFFPVCKFFEYFAVQF